MLANLVRFAVSSEVRVGVWLSLEALKLLELAFAQDLNSEDGHRVTVLFL